MSQSIWSVGGPLPGGLSLTGDRRGAPEEVLAVEVEVEEGRLGRIAVGDQLARLGAAELDLPRADDVLDPVPVAVARHARCPEVLARVGVLAPGLGGEEPARGPGAEGRAGRCGSPGTNAQCVAKPPPNSESTTQCPAVQTSVWPSDVTTVAEQTKSPGCEPPAIVKKTFPCTRPGKSAFAPLLSTAVRECVTGASGASWVRIGARRRLPAGVEDQVGGPRPRASGGGPVRAHRGGRLGRRRREHARAAASPARARRAGGIRRAAGAERRQRKRGRERPPRQDLPPADHRRDHRPGRPARAGSPPRWRAAAQCSRRRPPAPRARTQYAPSEKPWPSIPNAQLKRAR